MSGKKKVETKQPTFKADPQVTAGRNRLFGLSEQLTSGDFSGDLEFLQPLVDRDPEITRLALEQATSVLEPEFQDILTDIQNRAVAAGQGTTSALTVALGRAGERFGNQLTSVATGAALQDRLRALENTKALFGAGLDATKTGITTGLSAQQQQFSSEQNRFENSLAVEQLNQSNQGGFAGGLQGAIGGGLTGFMLGGPIGAVAGAGLGGIAGGFGSKGTGSAIMGAGTSFAGSGLGKFGTGGGLRDAFNLGDVTGGGGVSMPGTNAGGFGLQGVGDQLPLGLFN